MLTDETQQSNACLSYRKATNPSDDVRMSDDKQKKLNCGWRGHMAGGLVILITTSCGLAQSPPPQVSGPSSSVESSQSAPCAQSVDLTHSPTSDGCPGGERYSLWDTITLSIFNKHAPKREWTPLPASTFFTEGWLEPHIGPPGGSGGSVRQGWVGVPEAFFNRQIVGFYSHRHGVNGNPNRDLGAAIFESPLSRRYDFGFFAPFVDSVGGNGVPYNSTFGDVLFFNRFLIQETRDRSVSLNVNVVAPTGSRATGNDRTIIIPYLAFYQDLGRGFSVRGAGGADVPVDDRPDGRTASAFTSIAVGQTLTSHDTPIVGDFTYYTCVNLVEEFGTGDRHTFLGVTPGIRTHLGREWFFLAGLDVPVTGPRPFDTRATFLLVKGF